MIWHNIFSPLGVSSLRRIVTVGLWAMLLSVVVAQTAAGETADTVYVNARVYTVDEKRSWAEALAVSSGRIVAVGDRDAMTPYINAQTRIIDLGGRMAMPGIHDAHTHLLMAGLKWTHECRLPPNVGPQAIVQALQQCAKDRPGDGWLVAGDFNPNVFGEAPLNRAFLDAAFPDRPVFLYEFSIHHALVNGKALALAGIGRDTPNPVNGEIRRNPVGGEATGELVEMATALVTRAIPPYADSVHHEALEFAIKRCHEFGITSLQEASGTRRLLELYRDFDRREALNLWVMTHIVWGSEKWGDASPAELDRLISERAQFATEHIDTDAAKVWLDGAPLPPYFSEAAINPTTDRVEQKNLLVSTEDLAKVLKQWRAAGIKPKLHVAGDGAARVALDAVEIAYGGVGNENAPRPDLAHNALITGPDIARYAKLKVVAEMSPAIWQFGAYPGFEFVNDSWPFASLLAAGAVVTMASDWILPPDPNLFPALEGLVTRPNESASLAAGIDMLTRNGAASVGQSRNFGTIEVGKLANLIVLDRNLFEIDVSDVGETRVLMTLFEGRVMHLDESMRSTWEH
jgi:predicted amidohydrolase YtcJ